MASCSDSLHCHGYKPFRPLPVFHSRIMPSVSFFVADSERTQTAQNNKTKRHVYTHRSVSVHVCGKKLVRFWDVRVNQDSSHSSVTFTAPLMKFHTKKGNVMLRWGPVNFYFTRLWYQLSTKLQKSFFHQTNWFWLPLKISAAAKITISLNLVRSLVKK